MYVDGFGGIAGLLAEVDELNLTQKIKEQHCMFIQLVNQVTNLVFRDGAIFTNKGELLGHGRDYFKQYPEIIEALKVQPGFSLNKSQALALGYDIPAIRAIKTMLRTHFIRPDSKDLVKMKGHWLYLPAPSTRYNPARGYGLSSSLQALSIPLEEQREMQQIPPVIPAITIVSESFFDMAMANQSRQHQLQDNK